MIRTELYCSTRDQLPEELLKGRQKQFPVLSATQKHDRELSPQQQPTEIYCMYIHISNKKVRFFTYKFGKIQEEQFLHA